MPHGEPVEVRFERFVQKSEGCWLWLGSRQPSGYGQFKPRLRTELAHRYAYITAYGAIRDDLWVLHRCDNRPCVRPDHLFLGTPADNMHDMIAKGRARPVYGTDHHAAKLNEESARAIREKVHAGVSTNSLALEYGVSPRNIRKVAARETWRRA